MTRSNRQTSRAENLGLNADALGRKVSRFVDKTRQSLEQIAYTWDELDASVDADCTDLTRRLEEFEREMLERVKYAKQPPDEVN